MLVDFISQCTRTGIKFKATVSNAESHVSVAYHGSVSLEFFRDAVSSYKDTVAFRGHQHLYILGQHLQIKNFTGRMRYHPIPKARCFLCHELDLAIWQVCPDQKLWTNFWSLSFKHAGIIHNQRAAAIKIVTFFSLPLWHQQHLSSFLKEHRRLCLQDHYSRWRYQFASSHHCRRPFSS